MTGRIVIGCVASSLLILTGCGGESSSPPHEQDNTPSSSSTEENSVTAAQKKLKLLSENANVKSQTARYTADGEFHHFRVELGQEDHLSRDIGILKAGGPNRTTGNG